MGTVGKRDWSSIGKAETLRRLLSSNRIILIAFVMVSILFISILLGASRQLSFSILLSHVPLFLVAVVLSLLFVTIKAIALRTAFSAQGIHLSAWKSIDLFLTTTFIEITLIPSKVTSDIFKFFYLKHADKKQKVQGIILFRLATMSVFFAMLIGYLFSRSWLWGVAAIVLLSVLWLSLRGLVNRWSRRQGLKGLSYISHQLNPFAFIILLTLFSLAIEIARAGVLLSIFGVSMSWSFALAYVLAHVLGVLSTLPFGIGVKDLSLGAFLSQYLPAGDIVLFLILLRALGELLAGTLGWALLARHLPRLSRGQKKEGGE
ncbi:MAG: lysylphosphatidylglycerol synthase domain-containing protein [archaeon]